MNNKAFTLIEICFVIVILAAIISIAIPAINSSRQDSTTMVENATAKTLNEAITRAQLKEDPNIEALLLAQDQSAIIQYLDDNNYIQKTD